MNLASLNLATAANAGTVLTVLHPDTRAPLTGPDGAAITITLYGRDSKVVVDKQREQRNLLVDEAVKKLKFSAAAQDLRDAELLAVATLGWTGIPQAWLSTDGEDEAPADFSEANAMRLYTNPGVAWLREQVVEHFDNRGNVLRASRKA